VAILAYFVCILLLKTGEMGHRFNPKAISEQTQDL
jgi:hypothetical protein